MANHIPYVVTQGFGFQTDVFIVPLGFLPEGGGVSGGGGGGGGGAGGGLLGFSNWIRSVSMRYKKARRHYGRRTQ